MSDELRLPDNLAACEAKLASQVLAPITLNRDELLYRAGWAAAEAECARQKTPMPLQSGVRRRTVAAWSITSAGIAASLAVALTLAVASPARPIASVPEHPVDDVEAGIEPSLVSSSPRRDSFDPVAAKLEALVGDPSRIASGAMSATLWALAERPRTTRFDEPILVTTNARSAVASRAGNATARALLHEMFPSRTKSSERNDRGPSGILEFLRPFVGGGDTI